ncbi:Solute carrier 2, facilitated glucose transporter member 1 [Entophlyctis sp. JEL0112]|nr:Solute carrier 2, facilitated glucose transporter member 1 [Entophlyctis sp. JEL0112]
MSILGLCVGTAALTALTFGYHLGEVNQPRAAMSDCTNLPPLPIHAFGLPDCIPMTDVQWGLFVSVFLLGGTLGGLSGGTLAARLGRRRLLFVNNTLLITSALVLASAPTFFWLCVGRVVGGIGAGIGTVAVPLLIAELSPVSQRGSLGALNQLAIVVGILASQTLGVPLSAREDSRWRVLFLLGIAPPLAQCALLPFCVESPRWLVTNRLIPDARRALQRLRGGVSPSSIEDELAELMAANGASSGASAAGTPRGRSLYRAAENANDQETGGLMERAATPPAEVGASDARRAVPSSSVSVSQLFTIPALKRPLLACIGLQVTQQFSGINAAAFYSTTIFNQSYPPDVAIQLTLLVSFVNVVATLASLVLIERLGRRYLLLASELGMMGCGLVIFFAVQLGLSPIFVVAGLMGFVGLFGIGLGAIPWLILPELVPGYAANTAVSVCSGFNWGCSWFVAFTLPILIGISDLVFGTSEIVQYGNARNPRCLHLGDSDKHHVQILTSTMWSCRNTNICTWGSIGFVAEFDSDVANATAIKTKADRPKNVKDFQTDAWAAVSVATATVVSPMPSQSRTTRLALLKIGPLPPLIPVIRSMETPGQQVYIHDELNFCIGLPNPGSLYLQETYYNVSKLPTILNAEGYIRAFCVGSYVPTDALKIPDGGILSAHVVVNDDYYQVWGFLDCDVLNINCTMSAPGSFSDSGQYDNVPYHACGKEPYSGVDTSSSGNPGYNYWLQQAGHGGSGENGMDRPIYCMRVCKSSDSCPATLDRSGCHTTMGIDFTVAEGFSFQDNRTGSNGAIVTTNVALPTTTAATTATNSSSSSVNGTTLSASTKTSTGRSVIPRLALFLLAVQLVV